MPRRQGVRVPHRALTRSHRTRPCPTHRMPTKRAGREGDRVHHHTIAGGQVRGIEALRRHHRRGGSHQGHQVHKGNAMASSSSSPIVVISNDDDTSSDARLECGRRCFCSGTSSSCTTGTAVATSVAGLPPDENLSPLIHSLILVFPRPEPDPMFGLLIQSQTRPDMSTFVRGEMG